MVTALLLAAWCSEAGLLEDLEFFDVQLQQKVFMGPVEPETVRGFEVLYATPGSGDVSEIAGHLLLRILLNNNPEADESGIENPNDLVISFLADTESGKPPRDPKPAVVLRDCHRRNWFNLVDSPHDDESPWDSLWQSVKGLSGGFNIIMDRQTLGAALKSYTVEQDRDLLRYRLNLTDEQKKNLLDHLVWVKSNYEPPYYFFSQNCGSVLIQIIGEGIGSEVLSEYSRWVTPPHTLLGNMIREGLATRAAPAFYSYRKKGFIAREIFREEYKALGSENPEVQLPGLSEFFHRKESVRARALAELSGLVETRPELRLPVYRLAVLAQETEMVHSHKDWVCEDYTSEATAEARRLQKSVLFLTNDMAALQYDVLTHIQETFSPVELSESEQGTPHTGSYTFSVGAGVYEENSSDAFGVLTLKSAFLIQEMGAPSSVAMQRQSAIELGGVHLIADEHGLAEWRFTGIRLTKFRDTLFDVPSIFTSTRGLGLGLTVLDVEHRRSIDQTKTTIAGVSILGNGISSANYNSHLFFTAGADFVVQDEENTDNASLRFPVGLESLVSLGHKRRCQWRNSARYYFATHKDNRDELEISSRLGCRLGEWRGAEYSFGFSVEYEKEFKNDPIDAKRERIVGSCRIQIKRW